MTRKKNNLTCLSLAVFLSSTIATSSLSFEANNKVSEIAHQGRLLFATHHADALIVSNLDGSDRKVIEAAKIVHFPDGTAPSGLKIVGLNAGGTHIAIHGYGVANGGIFVYDFASGRSDNIIPELVTEVIGPTTYVYDHPIAVWSPDGKRIVVLSHTVKKAILTVYETATHLSKRILTLSIPDGSGGNFLVTWGNDSKTVLAIVPAGDAQDVLTIDSESLVRQRIYSGKSHHVINSISWDPSHETLALLPYPDLVLFKAGKFSPPIPLAHAGREMAWSPSGKHVVILDYSGNVDAMTADGKNRWIVADDIQDKLFASQAVWIDEDRFAFTLTTKKDGNTMNVADVKLKSVSSVADKNVLFSPVQKLPGASGILFLESTIQGPWTKGQSREEYFIREIGADVRYYDISGQKAYALTSGGFIPGSEVKGDFSPHCDPFFLFAK